jgi:hypothetical protein
VHAAAASLHRGGAVVDGAGSAAGAALVRKLVSAGCPVVAATTGDVHGYWGEELRRGGAQRVEPRLRGDADGAGGVVTAPLVFTTRGVTPEAVAAVSPGGALVVLSQSAATAAAAAATSRRPDVSFIFATAASVASPSVVAALIADAARDIAIRADESSSRAAFAAFAASDARPALLRLTSGDAAVPVVLVASDDGGASGGASPSSSPSSSVLITGGTGALGARVGLWLVSARGGARRVVLTGRSGRADWSMGALRSLGGVPSPPLSDMKMVTLSNQPFLVLFVFASFASFASFAFHIKLDIVQYIFKVYIARLPPPYAWETPPPW